MKVFGAEYLDELSEQARTSPRKRQHRNLHSSYADPCQRLFNAIEPGSYIRPHRHASDPRHELLIAVRGSMVLVVFDDRGRITTVTRLGSGARGNNVAAGVEVPSDAWHTVLALEPGCVLLEVKAGPFDPERPKDLALWAPEEGTSAAEEYLRALAEQVTTLGLTSS